MRSVSAIEDSLREALCAWLEGDEASSTPGQSMAAAEAWVALAEPAMGLDASTLAVTLSETMPVGERDAVLAQLSARAQLEAAEDFLTLATASAPQRLVEVARRLLDAGSNVVTLASRPPSNVQAQTFRLRAAASIRQEHAVLCKSDSGIWTLEVFTARGGDDGENASLLLSVDPDYRATYEGLRAKVFVLVAGEERVLAEADVRNGELYAGICLEGLDLFARDAISVVFAAVPSDDAG